MVPMAVWALFLALVVADSEKLLCGAEKTCAEKSAQAQVQKK